MFAAGEIMAGNVLGRGYAAGIGMTIGSVFGRVAGREAAAMPGTDANRAAACNRGPAEADRLMTVCNSCRYCEGLCAVFPAMEMRAPFADGDSNYLANLCHGCGACYVRLPVRAAARVQRQRPADAGAGARNESYSAYAWPRALAPAVRAQRPVDQPRSRRSASRSSSSASWRSTTRPCCSACRPGRAPSTGSCRTTRWRCMFGAGVPLRHRRAGHGLSAAFWRDIGEPRRRWREPRLALAGHARTRWRCAISTAAGMGCFNEDERPTDRRRLYHHLTFYGFLLCFAATSVATLYHYLLGREAPYPWYDLPVVLGTLGGIGLVVGPAGLLSAKCARSGAAGRERAAAWTWRSS